MKSADSSGAMRKLSLLTNPRRTLRYAFITDREFTLLIIAGFISGIAGGINTSIFNNYLNQVYHLSEISRGLVEIPRELPGFLMMFIFAGLSFLNSTRLAALSMIFASLGMAGLGLLSPSFGIMLIWMVVLNLGTHLFMPLVPGMGMHLSKQNNYGARLANYNAYNLAATIIGYFIVWLGFSYLNLSFAVAFIIASACYLVAGLILFRMKPLQIEKRRFVFKKKYSLFYALSIVNGARKQIFLTFAPWVLIKIYNVDTATFAVYGFIIAAISIGTRTIVGKAIDKLGERIVLSAEAILLIVLCMGYAFSANIFPVAVAVIITAGCYVLDNSLTAVEMARSTYVRKISDDPNDVLPTLSTGITLDHIVSMTIPFFGGMLWEALGYQIVFVCASFIALTNLILSFKIKT
jgi:MFS family permease